MVILLDVSVDQVSQSRLGRRLDVVYVCHVKLAHSVQSRLGRRLDVVYVCHVKLAHSVQSRLGRRLDVVYVCHVKLAHSVQRLNRGGISVLNQLTHDIRTSVHQSCGEKGVSVVTEVK